MRRNPTDAERALWLLLRSRRLVGYKFRRQHSLGSYVADFYCPTARLVIEVDGGQNEKGTWGKVARWWDYHGKLEGKAVGLMVMSAEANGEVWSHSRDYGVLVANPVRGKPRVIKAGESLRLRLGVQVHEHDAADRFDRDAAYERFLKVMTKD